MCERCFIGFKVTRDVVSRPAACRRFANFYEVTTAARHSSIRTFETKAILWLTLFIPAKFRLGRRFNTNGRPRHENIFSGFAIPI
jgi:hypothetical protein